MDKICETYFSRRNTRRFSTCCHAPSSDWCPLVLTPFCVLYMLNLNGYLVQNAKNRLPKSCPWINLHLLLFLYMYLFITVSNIFIVPRSTSIYPLNCITCIVLNNHINCTGIVSIWYATKLNKRVEMITYFYFAIQ